MGQCNLFPVVLKLTNPQKKGLVSYSKLHVSYKKCKLQNWKFLSPRHRIQKGFTLVELGNQAAALQQVAAGTFVYESSALGG